MENTLQKEEIFNAKREELLRLLNKAKRIIDKLSDTGDFDLVSEDVGNEIEKVRQYCYEGLFSIALIAGFQSGKSTILNAFANGREIAPRGLEEGGIKISACLVKVQNPRKGNKETVKVNWRSHQDLLQRLDETLGMTVRSIPNSETSKRLNVISRKIDETENTKEKELFHQKYYSILDFENPTGKTLLEEALKLELESYCQSESKGSSEVRI